MKLARRVYMEDVTIDHVSGEVAHDLRPAPRHMEVWGLVEGKDNIAKVHEWRERRDAERHAAEEAGQPVPPNLVDDVVYPRSLPKHPEYFRIANFTYDIHAPEYIQTFPVRDEIKELGIDFGAKAGQLCLEARVVGHTLGEHLREHVDGRLQIAVALDHDAKDEVLEVSVRLLLLCVCGKSLEGKSDGDLDLFTLKEQRS